MSAKDTAKPAPKKKFSKDDVKTLYKAIEYEWKEDALLLAFAASGSRAIRGGAALLRSQRQRHEWADSVASRD